MHGCCMLSKIWYTFECRTKFQCQPEYRVHTQNTLHYQLLSTPLFSLDFTCLIANANYCSIIILSCHGIYCIIQFAFRFCVYVRFAHCTRSFIVCSFHILFLSHMPILRLSISNQMNEKFICSIIRFLKSNIMKMNNDVLNEMHG